MSIKWVLAVGVGLVGGWAARSLADSPEGAGVKLLEIALKTKERVGRWAALGRADDQQGITLGDGGFIHGSFLGLNVEMRAICSQRARSSAGTGSGVRIRTVA